MKNSLLNIATITKRLSLLVMVICFNQKGFAQYNLVPNPSFEEYTICPVNFTSPPPTHWYMPTNYGLSYYNSCSSHPNWGVPRNHYVGGVWLDYQYARTGNAYIASYLINQPGFDQRNYFQVKLKDSLRKGRCYYTEFYVVCPNDKKFNTNNVSMLLTNTAVYVDTISFPFGVLPANAQIFNYGNPIIKDTQNWVKVSGIYMAQGGEQFLTLGNFKDDAHTNYFASQPTGYDGGGVFFDDVSVIPLDSFCLKADAGKDTTITLGDSVFIGSYTNGLDSVKWFVNGTTLIDSIRPGFWVKPTVTTSYVLQQTINGCFSADTVWVNVSTVPLTILNYELRFTNETRNGSNEKQVTSNWTTANEINVSHFNIQRSVNGKDFTTIGTQKAHNQQQNKYTYTDELTRNEKQETWYYRIESTDKDGKKQYSETKQITIQHATSNNVFVYPNPAKDVVTISSKEKIKEIMIIDCLGKNIIDKKISNNELPIVNVQSLNKGLYLLKITTQKNVVYNEKFIKQ